MSEVDEKKQAIAHAAEHVVGRSEAVITEVIDKDEDVRPSILERVTLSLGASMLFGATAVFFLILVAPLLLGGHVGWWKVISSPAFWSNGIYIVGLLAMAYGIFAFLFPRRALRYFSYLQKFLWKNS